MEEELIRIAVMGVIAALLAIVITERKPEMGLMIGLVFGVIVLLMVASKAGAVINLIRSTADKAGMDAKLLVPVFKVVGMAYITQFSADACKDAGQNSIASKVEIAGKIMMLVVAVPIATSLIEIVSSIL